MNAKNIYKKFFAITFFALAITAFSTLALTQATCKDCGSVGNCLDGNGFETGYINCAVGSEGDDVWCVVSHWCGS